MTISVIIPAWNAQRYIARAIQSVLAQTRPAEEIIVVDDGSTDGTAEAVRAFGTQVRLISQPNGGVSVARNTGISAACGDWIAFLDADDEWLPEKLQLQYLFFQRHPQLKWGYGNFAQSGDGGKTGHPLLSSKDQIVDDYLDAYCRGFYAWTGTVMVHRSVFEAVGGFEPGMRRAQDNDLWFRIAYQFPQVGYIAQSLAIYHLDTPGSSTKINDQVDFMIGLIERHRGLSRQFNRTEAFRPCIVHMLHIWIRQLEKQNRRTEVKQLLHQYNDCLSPRFCREIQFRLLWLPWTSRVADFVLGLKNQPMGSGNDAG